MKKIDLLLLAIALSLVCSAVAHADGVLHTSNGDIRYTTEQIGSGL